MELFKAKVFLTCLSMTEDEALSIDVCKCAFLAFHVSTKIDHIDFIRLVIQTF
jgi:hypothetical protein